MSKTRPAFDTLRDFRDGKFLDELAVELNDLIRQVRLLDKKGSMTIKLEVIPVNGDATTVTLLDKIETKPPQMKNRTLFFTTPDSNLSRRDPRQPSLPGIGEVDQNTGEIITPNNEEDQSA